MTNTLFPQAAWRVLQKMGWIAVLAIIFWSFLLSEVSLSALIAGYPESLNLVSEMFPPDFSKMDTIFELLAETIAMGVWGTLIGMILSFPLGFLGAKNFSPHPAVYYGVSEIINLFRSIPDMVYALVFVISVGIGSLSGILALIFATVGLLSKFYAEAFEAIDMKPVEAIRSTGSGYFSTIRHALIPQALPLMSNYNLFILDHNIRAAMVLGLVGAGGIGVELYTQLKYFSYDRVAAILIVVLVLLSIIDRVSVYTRDLILHSNNHKNEWFKKLFLSIVFSALGAIAIIYRPEELGSIIEALPRIAQQLSASFPPDFSRLEELLGLMGETIAMAITATVLAVIFSLPLSLLIASNIQTNRYIKAVANEFVNFLRAIPDLIFALILVAALGLGPFAGVLAIMLHVTGFLAKFYAETIESIDPKPIEALKSTGASSLGVFRHGIFPQIFPLFTSYNLYILDRNVRASTTMGIVGAGGIGFELIMSIRLFEFQQTATIILLILIVVAVINRISAYFRHKLI